MKYYVVADPHGFYSLLQLALRRCGYFDDTAPHKLIVLGDVMDRGDEAVEMQRFVLGLLERGEVILVRGNHEDLFRDFVLLDDCRYMEPHISNGTHGTAMQLSGFSMAQAMVQPKAFKRALEATPFFTTIMPSMVDYYETEHYVFVHGWIPAVRDGQRTYSGICDWRKASSSEWEKARWYNGMDAARSSVEDKVIVCGHWHVSYGHAFYEKKGSEFGMDADFSPYYGQGIIALDACTAYSGQVNCIILDD